MQADLFAQPAAAEQHHITVQSAGRKYTADHTDNGLAINWTGPGKTQGVLGGYYHTDAGVHLAIRNNESRRLSA